MTDGIIQKVFKKYRLDLLEDKDLSERAELAKQIEQQIIAEIKKSFPDKVSLTTDKNCREKLIGDNQE